MLTDEQVLELRSHFPILREKTYLYSCSQGALSDAVEGGMAEYAQSWRTSSAPWEEWMEAYEALRAAFAGFINARPDEVALVASASAGINPIANALCFNGRDKVVMSEYEFPTMGHIWLAQRPRGARVEFLEGVENTVPIESYRQAIDERTRVVPLTHVSFINGFRSDVAAITRLAHDCGALVFLDGYQDCGTRPLDVRELGVDFFVTGTLKYLLGPPGLAFLYVRRELVESLTPTITSWMAQRDVFAFRTRHLEPAAEARRFEGGTPAIPNIYMARPAIELLMRAGMDNVAAQIERLARAFREGARERGIATKTPPSSVGPLVVVRSRDAPAVVARLAARGIVVSARHDGVRFSFHVYNTMEDVHTALTALEENRDLMVRA
ncbi:MAG: aminotransferase class V-fold PLP-dependent enzyme [Acidobacteriia bacterium]|nr:aminotransferase class V-fold PLP-dependent enzyme [Terriglobia bacterium]